jgi:hypothetical protein
MLLAALALKVASGAGNLAENLVANDFGLTAPATLGQHATGGLVRGPGTGTSDSILAWLSAGEYVLPAATVRHYGMDRLELLRLRALPRFAAGGLVGATRSAAPPVSVTAMAELIGHLQVGLDEGLILKTVRANFPMLLKEHPRTIGQLAAR